MALRRGLRAVLAVLLLAAERAAPQPLSADALAVAALNQSAALRATLASLGTLLQSSGNASTAAASGLASELALLYSVAVPQAQASLAVLPQYGSWSLLDTGEAIALPIAFADFASSQSQYSAAFLAALSFCLHISSVRVVVTSFATSSAGTTLLYFNGAQPRG